MLFAAVSLGCPEDDDGGDYDYDYEYNTTPTADIQRPASGAVLREGDVVTLEGTGDDYEDGILSGSALVWTGDWTTGPLGTDSPIDVRDVPPGAWTVTLTVTDSEGATSSATRSFTVLPEEYNGENQDPTATVIAPDALSVFPFGSTIVLEGAGDDPEEGTLPGEALEWLMLDLSVGGWPSIGRGARLERSPEPGVYNFQLDAHDSFGRSGSDQTGRLLVYTEGTCAAGTLVLDPGSIQVAPGATGTASVTINPSDIGGVQLRLEDGLDAVTDVFTARQFDPALAYNPEDATRALTYTARPDVAVGQTFELQLRAYFYDLNLLSACGFPVQIEIVGGGANTAPAVTIDNPAGATRYYSGMTVVFDGTALDAEDGELSGASLVWVSDLDGTIGTGRSFDRSDLSVGLHTVTLTATDSQGASSTATVQFEIVTPNTDCLEFTIVANPNPVVVAPGGTASVGIQIYRVFGFTAPVLLTLEGTNVPVADALSSLTINPAQTTGNSSTLDFTVAGGWAAGTGFEFTLRGFSEDPTASCSVPLTVVVN